MKIINKPWTYVLAAVAAGLAVWIWFLFAPSGASNGFVVDVKLPALTADAAKGKAAFDANCAGCHGRDAAGTGKGPPLIHEIYNPGHHSDAAFFLAVRNGVRRHHWPYGDMPRQPQVEEVQIAQIVQYVRELQAANGIRYRSHGM